MQWFKYKLPSLSLLKEIRQNTPVSLDSDVVYFLFKDEELIYIGHSKKIFERLAAHTRNGRVFDDYVIAEFQNTEYAKQVEKQYIIKYKPQENKQLYTCHVIEAQFCNSLEDF